MTYRLSIDVNAQQRHQIRQLLEDNDIRVNIAEEELQGEAAGEEEGGQGAQRERHFPRQRHIEGEAECPHCLCAPCIVSERYRQMWWPTHDSHVHNGNTTKRKPLYRRFWSMLFNSGAWNDPRYLVRKTEARGGDVTWHRREIMPMCVVDRCRQWYPNPDTIPYMGQRWN